jgi:signal transduction histidine kinase
VRLRFGDGDSSLLIEVCEDGQGSGGAAGRGVGLGSMRERASELGGTCDIASDAGNGTTVRATLPLPRPQQAGEAHE